MKSRRKCGTGNGKEQRCNTLREISGFYSRPSNLEGKKCRFAASPSFGCETEHMQVRDQAALAAASR